MKQWFSTPSKTLLVGITLIFSLALKGDNGNSCCSDNCSVGDCSVRTFIPARSQGTNSATDYAGIIQLYHTTAQQSDKHALVTISAEYTNAFRPTSLSSALFGCDLVESRNILQSGLSLNLTGSGVQNIQLNAINWSRNNKKDWLAGSRVVFLMQLEDVFYHRNMHLKLRHAAARCLRI